MGHRVEMGAKKGNISKREVHRVRQTFLTLLAACGVIHRRPIPLCHAAPDSSPASLVISLNLVTGSVYRTFSSKMRDAYQ